MALDESLYGRFHFSQPRNPSALFTIDVELNTEEHTIIQLYCEE
jgi:hypothetical protein